MRRKVTSGQCELEKERKEAKGTTGRAAELADQRTKMEMAKLLILKVSVEMWKFR